MNLVSKFNVYDLSLNLRNIEIKIVIIQILFALLVSVNNTKADVQLLADENACFEQYSFSVDADFDDDTDYALACNALSKLAVRKYLVTPQLKRQNVCSFSLIIPPIRAPPIIRS